MELENRKYEFERLSKEYRDYLDVYESKSLLRKVKGKVDENDLYAVAKKLDNTKNWMEFAEANGGLGDLGALQQISLGVVLGSEIIDPTPIFAGVQPIDSEVGLIYVKDIVSKTNKAGNTVGQKLMGSDVGRKAIANMADGQVEETIATGDGSTTDFAVSVNYPPVLKRFFEVHLASDPSIRAIDDGNGVLMGNGVSGTINYETGAVTLSFDNAPENGDEIKAVYQTSYGADTMDELPSIGTEYRAIKVSARTFALRSEMSLLKMYGLEKKFGISGQEMLAKDLTRELQGVIANKTIQKAYMSVPSSSVITESVTPPSGVSAVEARLSFLTTVLPKLQGAVLDASGRFTGNGVLIAGSAAATYLMGLPGFKQAEEQFNSIGTIYIGSLNGMPVIRTQVIPANEALYIAKGGTPLESGVIVAPYIPLFLTDTVAGINKNELRQGKAIASSLGIETPLKGMIAKLVLTGL